MPEWPPHEPDDELEDDNDDALDAWFEEADRRRKQAREDLLFGTGRPSEEEVARRHADLGKRHSSRRAGKGKR